jgi:hypothetical protein
MRHSSVRVRSSSADGYSWHGVTLTRCYAENFGIISQLREAWQDEQRFQVLSYQLQISRHHNSGRSKGSLSSVWKISISGTHPPHEQQTDQFAAAEIPSSYLVTDARIWELEISGGNTSEATARLSCSSRRKQRARSKLTCNLSKSTIPSLLSVANNGFG